jgi:hypothetical protein
MLGDGVDKENNIILSLPRRVQKLKMNLHERFLQEIPIAPIPPLINFN